MNLAKLLIRDWCSDESSSFVKTATSNITAITPRSDGIQITIVPNRDSSYSLTSQVMMAMGYWVGSHRLPYVKNTNVAVQDEAINMSIHWDPSAMDVSLLIPKKFHELTKILMLNENGLMELNGASKDHQIKIINFITSVVDKECIQLVTGEVSPLSPEGIKLSDLNLFRAILSRLVSIVTNTSDKIIICWSEDKTILMVKEIKNT